MLMQNGDLAGYFNQFGALGLGHCVEAALKTQYITTGDNRKPLAVYEGGNPTLSAMLFRFKIANTIAGFRTARRD